MSEAEHDPGPPTPLDHELLARAELALTQLNNQHGLAPDLRQLVQRPKHVAAVLS